VIAKCHITKKPSLSIPCYGERRYGHAQDDELAMAIPTELMEGVLRGMEGLYRRGVRYPISYAGAEQDLADTFPAAYKTVVEVERLRGRDGRLLVGITGGIATGKSTVVQMFKERGAKVIDFDLLAREVVEKGQPAWKDIVDYFGGQILNEDGSINRKKLGEIVFKDLEKKKTLEAFTHPRIHRRFLDEVERIAKEEVNPIILADIPLLIEQNLQYIFHKIILVYANQEIQLERLMKRDNITREQAFAIMRTQLPIEEKQGYADYVIYNERDLEHTKGQVEQVWKALKKEQERLIQVPPSPAPVS
jgi:dephospho-CoA kinase